MTIAQLRKNIASEVETYVESTVSEWYWQHQDIGESKLTLGMTRSILDGLFIAYSMGDLLDNGTSHRKDIVASVLTPVWDRYVGLAMGEHQAAWDDLHDLIDGTYELLYANSVADLF